MKNRKIMMIGTSLTGKGGVASVIQGYKKSGIFEEFKIDYYSTHCDGDKLQKIVFYLKNFFIIFLKLKNYSIVHIHTASYWSYRRLFFIIIISSIFGKKVILHIHGANFKIYFDNAYLLEKIIIKLGLRIADKVICLSSEWYENIRIICPNSRTIIIPNCIEQKSKYSEGNRKNKKRDKIILFLGELGKRKGVYDLISAISLLDQKNTFKLILAGNGEEQKIKKIINEHKLSKVVFPIGWVSGKEKDDLLKSANIFILPSYSEGLPISILEAMSYGIPIISTNVGGIPFAVENNKQGILINPGDCRAIADAIRRLLNDEKLCEIMRKSTIEKVEKEFSIKVLREKLENLYSSVQL